MTSHQILQPEGWPRPKGYANGVAAEGRIVFTAGVIGWNEEEVFEHRDFAGQFEQVLKNTIAILAEAGAEPRHIVRMTCYVTSKQAYLDALPQIGAAWKMHFGRVFPCMAVIGVSELVEDAALLEIETTAVIPAAKDEL
ncbi:MAG: RidA family protein [Parvularculaceae bacterium]|nr:RidA family protein [Parvularculaceae bacterium]